MNTKKPTSAHSTGTPAVPFSPLAQVHRAGASADLVTPPVYPTGASTAPPSPLAQVHRAGASADLVTPPVYPTAALAAPLSPLTSVDRPSAPVGSVTPPVYTGTGAAAPGPPAAVAARGEAKTAGIKTCTIKLLPQDQWISAAQQAITINPANAPAYRMLQQVIPHAVIPPEHLALLTQKYWGRSGVRLSVGFLDNPPADLRARILSHMNAWDATANVQFVETGGSAQVRIARTSGQGYWSYLGTDILSIPADQQTMNLDSFSMTTADSEFYRVVRHETGHTLGFPHEHLRSEIVARIDREKAIAYFMASQGWSRDQVIAQVLTPLDNSALIATADADPRSIMCYWLPASIMTDGVAIPGGSDIDSMDAQFAASVYPRPLPPPGGSGICSGVARSPNNLDLFVVGNDGVVYTSWWFAGSDWSGVNNNWRPIGGVFPVGAPVSSIARSPDNLDLFVVGNDGVVYTSWWFAGSDWSGVNNNWRPLGGFFPHR
jgi:Astacin (Peptidase family M12A)